MLIGLLALAGCGADETDPGAAATAASTTVAEPDALVAAIEDGAVVIDVRTPEEYAAGHLDGALNIDSAAEDFDEQVADLDPEASYVIYCASGNRAGQVIERLAEQGFTDMVNGGGYEELAAALQQP